MAAGQPPRREPAAAQRTVAGNRFERVLRAGRMKPAARREEWRDRHLVASNQRGETPLGKLDEPHDSPALQHRAAPRQDVVLQRRERRGIGLAAGANHEVPGGLMLLDLAPPDLPEPPAETIAGHRGGLVLGDDQSHPRVARQVVRPDHLQMPEAATPALGEAAADVGGAREPVGPRKARRRRQEPPCFDGSETVSRFRPFLRRRESTARPHRVAIRARNPCLLMRRLLRGR
jgi:hypothetical protein